MLKMKWPSNKVSNNWADTHRLQRKSESKLPVFTTAAITFSENRIKSTCEWVLGWWPVIAETFQTYRNLFLIYRKKKTNSSFCKWTGFYLLCSPGKDSPRTNSELVSSSNSLINTLQCIPTGSHPVLPVSPSTVTTVRPSWLQPLCWEQNYNLLTATFQAFRAHSWRTVSLWDVNINSDEMSLRIFTSPLLSVVQFKIYLSIMYILLPLQNIFYE